MKASHWIIPAAALSFVQATPASAGVNDPEVIIYRFPGVKDDGGAPGVGVATVFHCTNFSGATETVRVVARNLVGGLLNNDSGPVSHLGTRTFTTHTTVAYGGQVLDTGAVVVGTTAIAATSTNIVCTAMTINAANSDPVGVALRGIRFNPVPGSQE